MRLKKMEISGFKSFADKVSIEISKGISAIVGPNGCGKSNVVDALRWVMGEQSVKQLRGQSMEDVIFAGTNGKPPQNMAEVSLLLSNDNGAGPSHLRHYAELMLPRKVYRSGESVYLLNKRPCRLKDFHNVFAGSGMGSKSYAVIQQGNIGAITDASAESRRFFIEEAAGITRYKTRKIEAQRKIKTTEQNLLRLFDIINEVERSMNSLKRQANKAERYKACQVQIKNFDICLALLLYDQFTSQIEATTKFLNTLKDTDTQQNARLKQLDAAVEEIKLARRQKTDALAEKKAEHFKLQRMIDKNENDLEHLRQEQERVQKEIETLEDARLELEHKNNNIISEVKQTKTEYEQFKIQLTEVQEKLIKEQTASQDIINQRNHLNKLLEKQKEDHHNLNKREIQYQNTLENITSNHENLKTRIKRIDEDVVTAEKKAAEGCQQVKTASEQLEWVRQGLEELKIRITELKVRLAEKSHSLGSQVKLSQTLDLERSKIKSKLNALQKMADNYDWYKDGVKAVMQADFNPEGLLAEMIEPQSGYAAALEAALGEALQSIVVQDQALAHQIIEYLHTNSKGRCSFIPMDTLKSMETHHQNDYLLEHLTVQPEFEDLTQSLLGHVRLVSDLKEAAAKFAINPATYVTLKGDLISCQGVITGGSQDKLSGILEKRQELKKLNNQIADLDLRISEARSTLAELEATVRGLEKELQELMEEQNETRVEETDAEKELYRQEQDLKHNQDRMKFAVMEQEQLTDEQDDIQTKLAKSNQILTEIKAQTATAATAAAQTTTACGSVEKEALNFQERIVDFQLTQTSLHAKVENSGNTLRRLHEFQKDGSVRLDQLSLDINQKILKNTERAQKIQKYEDQLKELYERNQHFEKIISHEEEQYQNIETDLKQNDTTITDLKNKREATLEKIRVLELEQSQRKIKRDNINARIYDRYHQALEAFRPELEPETQIPEELEKQLQDLRNKLAKMGDINMGAIKEYEEYHTRFEFLTVQQADLEKAIDDLNKVIKKINKITQERFLKTMDQINIKLNEVFPRLFGGGKASLIMTEPEKPLDSGVEFMVHPPGKKLTRLSLLSGGEKALSAIAFIFSIFFIKPASFCILDEIDAPLDEANVYRFNELLKIIGEKSQIIMITHKKKSMEFADTLFGITMEQKGVSKLVSVDFKKKEERLNESNQKTGSGFI